MWTVWLEMQMQRKPGHFSKYWSPYHSLSLSSLYSFLGIVFPFIIPGRVKPFKDSSLPDMLPHRDGFNLFSFPYWQNLQEIRRYPPRFPLKRDDDAQFLRPDSTFSIRMPLGPSNEATSTTRTFRISLGSTSSQIWPTVISFGFAFNLSLSFSEQD